MKHKRILIVTQHFWPEQFRINDIVVGFLEDGIQVDVLCGLPNYPLGRWYEGYKYIGPRKQDYHGAAVYRAGEIPRKGNTGLMILLNYISWPFLALFSLPRLKGKYDAVFCYHTSPVLMCFPAIVYAKTHHIPLVTYVLDPWPENLYSVLPIKNRFLRFVALKVSDWMYNKSNVLISISEGLKKRLIERTKKPESLVHVIPQHCEDFYAEKIDDSVLREKYSGKFCFVFTGNFSPAQNLDIIIRAVVRAHDDPACKNICLLLVGDGMSRKELEKLVDELEARDYIHFEGMVPAKHVPAYTSIAEVLVIALSDNADLDLAIPAKLSSYMAAGKPILASLSGEGAKIVQDSDCGYVSNTGDEDALVQNIIKFCKNDSNERKRLGNNAFSSYEKLFKRSKIIGDLERVFDNLYNS